MPRARPRGPGSWSICWEMLSWIAYTDTVWVPGSSSGSRQATTPAAAPSATASTAPAQIRLRLVAMMPT